MSALFAAAPGALSQAMALRGRHHGRSALGIAIVQTVRVLVLLMACCRS